MRKVKKKKNKLHLELVNFGPVPWPKLKLVKWLTSLVRWCMVVLPLPCHLFEIT